MLLTVTSVASASAATTRRGAQAMTRAAMTRKIHPFISGFLL
jgi:hypothetical protein